MTDKEATYHDARVRAAETMYDALLQAAREGKTQRKSKKEPWQTTLTLSEGTLNLIASLLDDAAQLHRAALAAA